MFNLCVTTTGIAKKSSHTNFGRALTILYGSSPI